MAAVCPIGPSAPPNCLDCGSKQDAPTQESSVELLGEQLFNCVRDSSIHGLQVGGEGRHAATAQPGTLKLNLKSAPPSLPTHAMHTSKEG